MSLAVCIPCYKYHLPHLKRCLDSIEDQTVKPDAVFVSCSSSTENDIAEFYRNNDDYSFPYRIIQHESRKNAAENRNIAAKHVSQDYITFFDADDVMHPQRIEILKTGLSMHPKTHIFLHSYYTKEECNLMFPQYNNVVFEENRLARAPSGCAVHTVKWNSRIHHSQVTVKRAIWEQVKFREDTPYERREDAVFCGDVLALPGIQSLYCPDALSKYYEEGVTHV